MHAQRAVRHQESQAQRAQHALCLAQHQVPSKHKVSYPNHHHPLQIEQLRAQFHAVAEYAQATYVARDRDVQVVTAGVHALDLLHTIARLPLPSHLTGQARTATLLNVAAGVTARVCVTVLSAWGPQRAQRGAQCSIAQL